MPPAAPRRRRHRAVHVEPEPARAAHGRNRTQGIDAPVLTVPAVPTTISGTSPSRDVFVDPRLECRYVHALGRIGRRPTAPMPFPGRTGRPPSAATCAFRATHRRAGAPASGPPTPCSRTGHGVAPRRAANVARGWPCCRRSPSNHRNWSGSRRAPRASARSAVSTSVAAGDSAQAPTLALSADARRSPRMPIGAGDEVM